MQPSPAPTFHFVSYRQEVRGQEGDPPKNFRHWLLKDSNGVEHVAVDTVTYLSGAKCYVYKAVAPFDVVKPLRCRNQRDVMAYLDEFVPIHARQLPDLPPPAPKTKKPQSPNQIPPTIVAQPAGAPGSSPPASAIGGSGGGRGKGRGRGRASNASGANGHPRTSATAAKTTHQQPEAAVPLTLTHIVGGSPSEGSSAAAKLLQLRDIKLAKVASELEDLKSQFGMEYTLTLVGSDRQMTVLTSANDGGINNINAASNVVSLNLLHGTAAAPAGTSDKKRKAAGTGGRVSKETTAGAKKSKASPQTAATLGRQPSNGTNEGFTTTTAYDNNNEAAIASGNHKVNDNQQVAVSPKIEALVSVISKNTHAYQHGVWRLDPLPSHPFEEINTYVAAPDGGESEDVQELLGKLKATLTLSPTALAAAQNTSNNSVLKDDEYLKILPGAWPSPLQKGVDIQLQSVWGLDSYTRRNILEALGRCSSFETTAEEENGGSDMNEVSVAARDKLIDDKLLTALNSVGDEGWNITEALQLLLTNETDAKTREIFGELVSIIDDAELLHNRGRKRKPEGRELFRVHSKGDGVVCMSPNGIPAGSFVGEYVGQLYTPWRWHDKSNKLTPKQTSLQRKATVRQGASAKVYTVALERPKDDKKGYDVLYIDSGEQGSIASRLGHSCNPNCRIVPTVGDGKLAMACWTTRAIAPGEELTLDYNDETEFEADYHAATCLCGTEHCRGSFLHYNPPMSPALLSQRMFVAQHSLPHRISTLITAAAEPHLTFEDAERLDRNGFKESVLGTLPSWVRKWTALILQFIEYEAAELPALLKSPPEEDKDDAFSDDEAIEEASNQKITRIKALAITLDRARFFLRHQPDTQQGPPLRLLTDDEVTAFLWTGEGSIARRAIKAVASFATQKLLGSLVANRAPRRGEAAAAVVVKEESVPGATDTAAAAVVVDPMDGVEEASNAAVVVQGTTDTAVHNNTGAIVATIDTPAAAAVPLDVVEGVQQEQDAKLMESEHNNNTANGDNTVVVGTGMNKVGDDNAALVELLKTTYDSCTVTGVDAARQGLIQLARVLRQTKHASHAGLHDVLMLYANTKSYVQQTEYSPFHVRLHNGADGGKYKQSYLLSALCTWHRPEVDPIFLFYSERRSIVCLPDVDGCYTPMLSSGKFVTDGDRLSLLDNIVKQPLLPWVNASSFSFKMNHERVLASPQLDAVLVPGEASSLQGVVDELKLAF